MSEEVMDKDCAASGADPQDARSKAVRSPRAVAVAAAMTYTQ